MLAHAVCLAAALGLDCTPTQPPRSDFYALIPPTRIWACPRQDWFGYTARRCEAQYLALYLTRWWNQGAFSFDPDMTVIAQFDASLWALDPNPSFTDAIARIRIYQPLFAFADEHLRNAPEEKPLPDRFSSRQWLNSHRRHINDRYVTLLAQFWWRIENTTAAAKSAP